MPGLHERYTANQIHKTEAQLKEHGNCPAAELSAFKFFLDHSGQDIPWSTIQLDDELARAVQIGNLPSYLVHTEGQTWIALPQDDGTLHVRPFDVDSLFTKYETLRHISSVPWMHPSLILQNFIQSLRSNLYALSVIPSQETFKEFFTKSIRK